VHGPGAGTQSISINSAVFACLMAIATSYPEPPLVVSGVTAAATCRNGWSIRCKRLLDNPDA